LFRGPVPVTYSIDRVDAVVRTRCQGFVTLPEVLAHFDELANDPSRPQKLDVLLDLRSMTSLPATDKLRSVGDKMGEVRARVEFGACAIVVDSDPLYATAMLFEVVAARAFRSSRVFRDLYEAERWLKAQRSPAPPSEPREDLPPSDTRGLTKPGRP